MAQFPFTQHKRPPFWQKSKTNCKTLDYISSLPDCILHHILSFLDIEDAIKTSVLSKRWLSVWAAVPVLNFCHSNCKHVDEFASFVEKTLRFYSGPNLEKLLINFRYSNSLSYQADEWMDFAMRHNVEELCLDFGGGTIEYPHEDVYRMTQSMYSNSSLRKLNTVLCYFKPSGCVSWTSLKVLSIGYAEVNNDIVFKILLGSPVLEFLKLQHCKGDNQIIVSSSSLKELVIDGFWGSTGSVMEISAPNIRLLRLCGYMHRRKFMLINVSALVEADLSFVMETDIKDENEDYRSQCSFLQDLLGNLSHVQKLTIGTWCLQVLSICELQGLLSPLSNCTSLTLDSKINKWDIPGIASLLETSPELKELIINLLPLDNSEIEFSVEFEEDSGYNGGIAYRFDGGKYLKSKCLSLQIKIIEITGYGPRLAGFEFFSSLVEFLLESARMLEKMVVYAQNDILSGSWLSVGIEQELRDHLEASQFFLSCPRASPKATVILNCSIN